MLDYDVQFVGFDNDMLNSSNRIIQLNWKSIMRAHEKEAKSEIPMSSVFYRDEADEVDYCNCNKDDETDVTGVKWVGFKQQFFNQTLIADDKFERGDFEVKMGPENAQDTIKIASANLEIEYFAGKDQFNIPMQMYLGPNDFSLLKSYDLDLDRMVPLGGNIFRFINARVIIPLFNFLNGFIPNYGIIILILTLLIKLVLFPLTYRTYKSSAKMNLLKDDIKAINEKHSKDRQKAQMETMALYRKAGVNPAGGCLPTLLQMPILFAMYRFFPASIELRQQPFLWAEDLSTYDSIMQLPFNIPFYGDHVSLFTLMMTVSSFLYMRMNQQMTPQTNEAMASQMKIMQYAMPVMFLGIFNSLSAALTYYFFLSNIITYIQQYVIKKFFINEDKLKAQIAANKKKPVKKSNFQKRLEDMQRQSQELQKDRANKKRRKK